MDDNGAEGEGKVEQSTKGKEETENINEEKFESSVVPKGGKIFKFYFLMFGVGSLLCWNAILACLDFFNYYQSKFQVYNTYPLLNMALNVLFQFIQLFKTKPFATYKKLLTFGLICSIVIVIAIPFTTFPFDKNSTVGFILSAALILFNGFINAICSSAFFGLTSFFGIEYIVWLSTGQGVAGILMNVIRYVVLGAVKMGGGDKEQIVGSIIFFAIAAVILIAVLFCLLRAYSSAFFRETLKFTGEMGTVNEEERKERQSIANNFITDEKTESEDEKEEVKYEEPSGIFDEQQTDKIERNLSDFNLEKHYTFKKLIKRLLDICILTGYIYIVTFFCFPGVSYRQPFFDIGKYKVNTIGTIYNVFDTVGRYIVQAVKPTKPKCYIVSLIRTIFLFAMPLNAYMYYKKDININVCASLAVFWVLLLGLTNGIGSTFVFGIAPTLVPPKVKGKAGSAISFFFIIGIFTGTCVGFGSGALMDKIGAPR